MKNILGGIIMNNKLELGELFDRDLYNELWKIQKAKCKNYDAYYGIIKKIDDYAGSAVNNIDPRVISNVFASFVMKNEGTLEYLLFAEEYHDSPLPRNARRLLVNIYISCINAYNDLTALQIVVDRLRSEMKVQKIPTRN
jgi:hypothetical protein